MDTIYATNPINQYKQPISNLSWLWCLLFGGLFFAFKGVWKHFVISFVLSVVSFGVAWFIYPFFARKIVINSYLERGWSINDGSVMAPADQSQDSVSSSSSLSALPTTEPFDFKTLNPIVFGFVSLIPLVATYLLHGIGDTSVRVWRIFDLDGPQYFLLNFVYLFLIFWALAIGFRFQKKPVVYVVLSIFILNQASTYLVLSLNPFLNFQFVPITLLDFFYITGDLFIEFEYYYFFPVYALIAVALFFLQERLKKAVG
jgi:hypothetical protein